MDYTKSMTFQNDVNYNYMPLYKRVLQITLSKLSFTLLLQTNMEVDERFSHIAKDPRFKKIPNRRKKVKIDSRFQQMFTDKNFNTKYFVDKRGRKVKDTASEDLSTFYNLSDQDDELVTEPNKSQRNKVIDESDVEILENSTEEKKVKSKKVSGEKKVRQKSERNKRKSAEDFGENNIEEIEATFLNNQTDNSVIENFQELERGVPVTEDATRRLALCNMDWDKITANDLFVLFYSFLPSGGSIHSINIYPSDYGLERMKKEDEIGPTELVSAGNVSDDDMQDKVTEYNQEKLRQYQLNRLRYYYAVIECDCPVTAEKIYEDCDGMEYEASSSHLDLRFIPDDMVFEHEPTSLATVLPSAETYKPSEFITTALQQSTVRLTWDETDPKRVQTTMRNFSKDDLLDMDFKAYLASSSGEEESDLEGTNENKEDQDVKIAKYKALIEKLQEKEQENESENEMEVTWEVGLKETTEELVKRKKTEREQERLTPWESYLDKKKKRKKGQQKDNSNESENELPLDVDINDPFFAEELEKTAGNLSGKTNEKKNKRKRRSEQEETEEDKRKKAELQLLLMEDDEGKKHFNLKSIMKDGKKKKTRNKKEEAERDDFKIDLNDSRFSALYSSHHYAVDPSAPQFKKTKAMDSIIQEKQRRSNSLNHTATIAMETSDQRKTVNSGLLSLVKTVKSNTSKFQHKGNKSFRKR